MRKLIFGLLVLLPITMSCTEDEDKIIQTDLSTEASQLYKITASLSENLYFAMTPYNEYLLNNSLLLPGKPTVSIDSVISEVTLTFHPDSLASQTGKFKRSGILYLRFLNFGQVDEKVYMTYKDYSFEGDTIIGSREFLKTDSINYVESFSELIHTTPQELNTMVSGEFSHTKKIINNNLVSITSTGQLWGRNPAGREFSILTTRPHQFLKSCIEKNQILPNIGDENWMVSRGGVKSVNYKMNYDATDSCRVEAHATLPDGKRLLLNP